MSGHHLEPAVAIPDRSTFPFAVIARQICFLGSTTIIFSPILFLAELAFNFLLILSKLRLVSGITAKKNYSAIELLQLIVYYLLYAMQTRLRIRFFLI